MASENPSQLAIEEMIIIIENIERSQRIFAITHYTSREG